MPHAVPVAHKEFDKLVQHRDKLGKVTFENHYACHMLEGAQYFERPIGSGNLFDPAGTPCGRMLDPVTQKIDHEAQHIEFQVPSSQEELSTAYASAKDENAELRREIEALKLEAQKSELGKTIKKLEEAEQAKPATPSKFAAHAKKEN